MVLLPQGKIINNPDTVKLVNILPTTLGKESFFVVTIKLDDDSELMVERCSTRMEAERVSDQCCRLLNGEEIEEVPSFVEEDSSDSSDADESAEDSSSDWDDESSEEVKKTEHESKNEATEEESSSWGMSSEDSSPAPSKKKKASKKPVIQEPYDEAEGSSGASKKQKKKQSAVKVKSKSKTPSDSTDGTPLTEDKPIESPVPKQMPRVTSFIEGDSDEWIPDNGLDDWYE